VSLSRLLDNAGTVVLSGSGQVTTQGGSLVLTNQSGALVELQGDGGFGGDGFADEAITNLGVFRKAGGTGNSVVSNIGFTNAGTVQAQSGTLRIDGIGTNSGTLRLDGGATFSTGGAALTNAGGAVIEGTGTLATGGLVNSGTMAPGGMGAIGTLTVAGNLTQGAGGVVNLEIQGALPGEFDQLIVTGTHAMGGGTLNLAGLGGFTGPATDLPVMTFANRTGTLASSSLIAGANLVFGPSALTASLMGTGINLWAIDADGLWDVGSNWTLGHAPQTGEEVRLDRAAGLFTITVPVGASDYDFSSIFTNENLVVAGGTLTYGGASTFNAGLTLSGGALVANGTTSVNTLTLSGGTLAGSGAVNVSGPASWSAGTIAGSGTVAFHGATLAMAGAGPKTLDGRMLENFGSATLTGSDLTLASGAVFANRAAGTLALASNTLVAGAGSGSLVNEGRINKTSASALTLDLAGFANTGSLSITQGTLTLATGMPTTGAGSVTVAGGGATLAAEGAFNAGSLFLSGGTLSGAGSAAVGALAMSGGRISGAGVLTLNGPSTFSTAVSTIEGRTIENFGAATQNIQLRLDSSTVWNNRPGSSFDLAGDFPLLAFVGSSTFNNQGVFVKSAGTGFANLTSLAFNNSGSVNVNAGELRFAVGGGTHSGPFTIANGTTLGFYSAQILNAGAQVSGAGTLVLRSGTPSEFNDTVDVGTLEVFASGRGTFNAASTFGNVIVGSAAGTATFNASAHIGSLHARGGGSIDGTGAVTVGNLTMNGGILAGTGAFRVNGATLVSTNPTDNPSGTPNQINGRTVDNFGAAVQTGADLRLNASGTWNNTSGASYTVTDDSGLLSFTQPGFFNNAGAFTKSGGTGDSLMTGITFDNAGTVNIQSGRLVFNATSGTHSGTFNVASGAALGVGTGTHVVSGSIAGGTGSTVDMIAGAMTLNGTMTIGTLNKGAGVLDGTGDLAVTENYNQTGSAIGGTFRNLLLTRPGNFTAQSYTATGSLTLRAPTGALIDANGAATNASATSVTLVARDGIGASDALETVANTLNVTNTGAGNVAVSNAPFSGSSFALSGSNPGGAITVTTATADIDAGGMTAGSVTITTGGAIRGTAGQQITTASLAPNTLVLNAGTGVGTSTQALNVQPGTSTGLAVTNATAGDIVIAQPAGDLVIGGVGGATLATVAGGGYTVSAGGDLTLASTLASPGALALAAGGDVNVLAAQTATGNIAFTAGDSIIIGALAHVAAGGELGATAGNRMTITAANVMAPVVRVNAAYLDVLATAIPGQSALVGNASFTVNVTGDVTVQGGTVPGAAAAILAGPGTNRFVIGRDLLIRGGSDANATALVSGDPDLVLVVMGTIRLQTGAGAGASARLEGVSSSTIYIDFPMLGEGGYFVNGTEGAIWNGTSGMFAGGQPAILDRNLVITYGQPSTRLIVVPQPDPEPLPGPAASEVIAVIQQPVVTGVEKATNAVDPRSADSAATTEIGFKVADEPDASANKGASKDKEEERKKTSETPEKPQDARRTRDTRRATCS